MRFKLTQARLRALYTETKGAKNFFALRLGEDPEDPVGYYGLGLCFMRERNWQQAINHLNKALKLRPLESLFWRALGICYAETGKFDLAIRYLEKVNQDAEVAFYLGLSYEHEVSIDKTISIWQLAVKKFDPYLTINRSDFSRLYYRLGTAFASKKKMGWAHYYLAKYFELEGKQAQARYHFQKARRLTQDQALKTKIKKPKKEDKK
jgi:tetratricopeptide (TPR) repeat protein